VRVHFGAPPSVFVHSTGWRKLAEPSPHRLAQGGLLLGLCLGAVVSGLWHLGGIHVSAQFASVQGIAPLAVFLLSLVGLFALHEAIHALLHPGQGASKLSVLGISLKPFLLYASYLGTLGRDRFAAILVAPFLLLSALPATLFAAGFFWGEVSPLRAVLSVANAAASGVDLLGVALLLSQVPRGAVLQNDGWQTFWRNGQA
jgi:hypothetical protein